jgi:8-oxo-dGTP pyrophosphatase MutT (NUDIX family)
MANFVYAVLYDPNKRFLIAVKNKRGYFFRNSNGVGGRIIPDGKVLNGTGDYALPGGGLKHGETTDAGAVREFEEETGMQIPPTAAFAAIPTQHDGSDTYCAGFFKVDTATFNQFANVIIRTNLPAGKRAADDVHDHNITDYAQIHVNYPAAPCDNELATALVWDIHDADDWATIEGWRNDPTKGWFYEILKYFRNHV